MHGHFLKFVFLFPVLILCIFVAGSTKEQSDRDIVTSKWFCLTNRDGEWVIYHYCFAGIATIQLELSENGGTQLVVFSGQDSEIFDVLNLRRADDATILHVKNRYGSMEKDVVFRYVNSSSRIGEWEGVPDFLPFVRS